MAETFVYRLAIWLSVGIVIGIAFVVRAISKLDAAAQGASPLFFLIILPGCALLWPFILARWLSGHRINATPHPETMPSEDEL